MAYNNGDDEFECEIIERYGVFSPGTRNWVKEVNLVSWNGMPAKLDIRNWQKDHKKCGKGIALTTEEAEELVKLLNKILKEKPGRSGFTRSGAGRSGAGRSNFSRSDSGRSGFNRQGEGRSGSSRQGAGQSSAGQSGAGRPGSSRPEKETKSRAKKKLPVPQTLEPFYDELELSFGSEPGECKSARNTLLKKYHPDKNAVNSAFATRKTIKIKEAYDNIIAWWKENRN